MRRNYPQDPLLKPVKGVIFLKKALKGNDTNRDRDAIELLKSAHCQILSRGNGRMTVKASRGNLQKIKQSWLDNDTSTLSRALNEQISQIVIGSEI